MDVNVIRQELAIWALRFAKAVREGDIPTARHLFKDDVVGFGTRTRVMNGLNALVDQQWRHIWTTTRNFDFNLDQMDWGVSQGGDLAWLGLTWSSEGLGLDVQWFSRHGRASFVLEKTSEGWVCGHSHHSLDPVPERLAPPTPTSTVS
jgi:ketosteroid isomerase-like protein